MSSIIAIFLFKTLDCMFGTIKNLLLYKGKNFQQAICSTLANTMYAISLLYAFKSEFWSGLIALGLATFIGSYVPAMFMERLEKDKLYVYDITSTSLNAGDKFISTLRQNNVPFSYDTVSNSRSNPVYQFSIYSKSKASSSLIESLIPIEFNWNANASIIVKEDRHSSVKMGYQRADQRNRD